MKFKIYMGLTGLTLLLACGKFNLTPEVIINFQDPTELTESSFLLSWSINTTDYQSLTIFLAEDQNFQKVVSSATFDDISARSMAFRDLRGGATYYYRISLVKAPGDIFISKTKSIEMPFQKEFISFNTPDMANLKGSVYYRGAMEGRRPAIVMMHEFGIFVNGWINSDVLKLLVAEGYVCFIFYNRGHGSSTGLDNIQELLDDPGLLANDLNAALSYIQMNERVMTDSIGLMGASMGGSMAIAGNGNEVVRTSVALSPGNRFTNSLYPGIPFRSVFYLVGDQDIVDTGEEVLDFPAQAAELFEMTLDPKKMWVLENSHAHGTELLETRGVNEAIVQWFRQELPVIQ